MESLKKILLTFALMLICMGIIGGFGYAVWGGSYPIAIGVLLLACLAWPGIKHVWNEWIK